MTTVAALHDWLLFAHVLMAMLWLGAVAVVGAFAVRVLRGRDDVCGFVRSLRVIGPALLAPPPALLLASGVWLVSDSPAWSFGQGWVQLALVLFAAAFAIGAAHQSRAALAAERAPDRATAARHLRRWAWGTAVIIVLLVAATWDMVFKPGL